MTVRCKYGERYIAGKCHQIPDNEGLVRVRHILAPHRLHIADEYENQSEFTKVKKSLGKFAKGYKAFLVKRKDGDYEEVWGSERNILWGDERVRRII
jgi:hypothetical protein